MYDLKQVVTEPTHRHGHTLDLIIVRPSDDVHVSSEVTHALESDHFTLLSHFNLTLPPPSPAYKTVRNIRAIDRAALKTDLQAELGSPEACTADKYNTALRSVLDKHAPAIRRRVPARKPSPWFSLVSEELLQAKRDRRKAEKQWRASRLTVHQQIYKKAKHLVTSLVHKAKCLFYCNKIENAQSSKELYQITNGLCARTKTTQLPTTYPTVCLPNVFSEHFVQKIDNLRKDLDSQPSVSFPLGKPFQGVPLTAFSPVSESDVLKIIKSSAPKTCDLDPIPTNLLFECLDEILPHLTQIINLSLSSGSFPDAYKSALVKPLLKKPSLDPNELKNFRPVSNLSFVSKIIEKIVLSQLNTHLSANNLLDPLQSAYRPGHSTETALVKITNDLLLALDESKLSVLTLLDLSSAFDTIDHAILLDRLQHIFGIHGTVLDWLTSYLSDRRQTVYIDDNRSDPAPILCGVPQGSVLGPVLFVLYTSPLSDIIDSHSVDHHCFADDTQLYTSSAPQDISIAVDLMQECICDVKAWMTSNKLKLNDDKTEALIISSPRMKSPLPNSLTAGNFTIEFSTSAKNLGVIIDRHLTMHSHIQNLIRTLNFELRRISTIRHFLSTKATQTLVSSFILSRLDYCNTLFYGCPDYLLLRLQKIQNNAARLTLRVPKSAHITPHLKSLHWLPIEQRIQYKIACLCFNAVTSSGPSYLSSLVRLYEPSRTLRSSSARNLSIPRVNKSFGTKAFSFSAPTLWNSLPPSLRSSSSSEAFRSGMKTYLFKSTFEQ